VLNDVLGHPYVQVWAVRCLEQLRRPAPADGPGAGLRHAPGLARDLGYLGAIATVAAVRASAPAKVTVPVQDGAVYLPALGRLVLQTEDEAEASHPDGRIAILVVDGGAVGIQVADHSWTLDVASLENRSPHWEPVRKLQAPGICVAVEDTDPYRDCHQWPAAPRLSDAEFARWDESFQDAWRTIRADHAAYAPALAAGLSVVMPLQAGPEGRDISAAARQAFGAVGVALPADPVTLALLLIHEFQHVKLGAILDLYDLFDAADTRLYHAPWREDPRPFEGLFQGTYAHLAVSEFWRVRAQAETGTVAAEASQRYQRWHSHTRDAIETLAGSGSLTPLGARFVDHMRHSV
jgi:uncharacterized protein